MITKLFKIEDYKGHQLHINKVVVNPNGQKSQTVLIYKDEQPVGGTFADLKYEDAIVKAKNKIDKY